MSIVHPSTPRRQHQLVTILNASLIIVGFLLIMVSSLLPAETVRRDIFLGLGLALAPGGVLGLIADWMVFGKLIAALDVSTADLGTKNTALQGEINQLKVSTEFLKQSSDLGLEMIYTDRGAALREFAHRMEREAARGKSGGRITIVGSSIKGLLENVPRMPTIIETAIETECELHILLTHPRYSQLRENQEDRPTGAIEDEIFDGIRRLESCYETNYPDPPDEKFSSRLKLYKGTPTCFMILAGDRMLINPYPYEEEAYRSFCIAVRRVDPASTNIDPDRSIYAQYERAHFQKAWERNSVPYRHYWLEGPDPQQAWDRKSCYGDVFVVQDSGEFYLAVNLLGQKKADVRGMPTSVRYAGAPGDPERFTPLPDNFSVQLLDARTHEWRRLDDARENWIELHQERRRGKASYKVPGNLLNDYLMIGLFDPAKKVVNSNKHQDSDPEAVRGQPLPLFYVWLRPPVQAPDLVEGPPPGP